VLVTKWKQISFKLIHKYNWLLFLNFGFSLLIASSVPFYKKQFSFRFIG
jgi:hypothetical protein